MRARRRALWAVAALCCGGGAARADGAHGGGGLGGFSALTGPARYGPAAEVELYPGGRFGRFGVRAAYLGFEQPSPALLTLGVTYTAGAARPRLHVALHAEAGAAFPDARAAVGGGIHTQLWVIGPAALGLDTLALLLIGSGDSSLLLGSALTLRLAR